MNSPELFEHALSKAPKQNRREEGVTREVEEHGRLALPILEGLDLDGAGEPDGTNRKVSVQDAAE